MDSKRYQAAVAQIELVLQRMKLSRDEIFCVVATVVADANAAPKIEEHATPKKWKEPYPLAVRHLGLLEKLLD